MSEHYKFDILFCPIALPKQQVAIIVEDLLCGGKINQSSLKRLI